MKIKKPKKTKARATEAVDHTVSPLSGICLLISAVCLTVTLVIFARGPFRINEYEISSDSPYSIETISDALGDLRGENYLSLDREELSKKVNVALPYIKNLEFDFDFPFRMTVNAVAESVPYYTPREDGIYVFNDDLKLIEIAPLDRIGVSDEKTKLLLPPALEVKAGQQPSFELMIGASDIISITDGIGKTKEKSFITYADFSDPYNVKFLLDGKYLIHFGDLQRRDEKLSYITDIFENCAPKMFDDRTLCIDVSIAGSHSYQFDVIIGK